MRAAIGQGVREKEKHRLENVRREIRLGPGFSANAFEAAFVAFRQLYNVEPARALCAPDVLARYCELYARKTQRVHQHSTRLVYHGVPLSAAVLAPGIIAFEGEVDSERMGDW